MRADDARWLPALVGFCAIRFVDKWADALGAWCPPRPSEVAAVRDAIAKIPAGPVRDVLSSIVDAVTQAEGGRRSQVIAQVLAYAAILNDQNERALEADVYGTFLSFASDEHDRGLIPLAWTRRGACLVWLGLLDQAEVAHTKAQQLGADWGDQYAEYFARHGMALIALRRGNLPEADARFGALVADCESRLLAQPVLIDVLVRSMHDQGWVALERGDTDRAFALLHDALKRNREPRQHDRIVQDLAMAFAKVGMRDVAQETLVFLHEHGSHPMVRWASALNLMYLALLDGSQVVFEQYRNALVKVELPPRYDVDYLLYKARGHRQFGREAMAQIVFGHALERAEQYRFNTRVIEIDDEAKRRAGDPEPVTETPNYAAPGEITVRVAAEVRQLCAEPVGAGG